MKLRLTPLKGDHYCYVCKCLKKVYKYGEGLKCVKGVSIYIALNA